MKSTRKSNQKLTPLQLLIVLVILIGVAFYRYLNQGLDEPQESTPAAAEIEEQPVEAAEPTTSPRATAAPAAKPAANFDFYVLNLSWSPDYCASNGAGDVQQCSSGKKYGFVLHGLWPQYNQGYPSNCSNQKLPADLKAEFPTLYPSEKLYDHEWEKHGTCSGLGPAQYLALSKSLKDSVVIPKSYQVVPQPMRVTVDELKGEFVEANPGLEAGGLAIYCSGSGRFLKELYVCFSLEGQPAECSSEIHRKAARSCQQADFLVRNIR